GAVPLQCGLQMLPGNGHPLRRRRRRDQTSRIEVSTDLAEDPGIADRRPADHDAIDTIPVPVLERLLRTVDVPVTEDGNMHPRVVLHRADQGPVRLPLVQLTTRTAMDRERPDTGIL